ncbi:hypothetical protein KOW79_007581 [Hemibagrus wyckioides]|uniref:Uncharacterized protein n=1 Tax=Hemibagrus wyckioides TaxID=337641 RepID=A0A9D3SMC6_9TELE|nr:hypothetical protein KOW79_007581 [Hemibagrus wyckioides]
MENVKVFGTGCPGKGGGSGVHRRGSRACGIKRASERGGSRAIWQGGSSDLTPGESLTAGQAEATEGVAEASTLVRPDWASMEFSDGMEDVGSDPEQDMGEGGRLSGSGATTEAEGATEERRTKRSRLERGRELDLLTAGDIIEGAAIGHDLVLYGSGLGHLGPGMARPLWQAVSVAKCILWGVRCEGIRSLSRRVSQARLFRLFRAKLRKVQGEEQGGEGFVRVAVGVLEGGGFSGTTVLGAPWWPDRAREKGEEAVFTEGAAEPAASSGPVSEEVAGPSGKEVRLTQAEGGSSDLTPGESLTAGQVTPAVGAPSGEEQASWPGLGLEAGLFGIWAEATEGVAEASTLV